MAFGKIKTFRDNFYKYIGKADLFIAFTTILSSLATTTISSMYTYLNDKDSIILRKANNPTNHINIDFISEDRYLEMIDESKWLSAEERDKKIEIEKQQKEELQKHKDEDNLPPSAKKVNKIQQIEYFVVSEGDGEFRDPRYYRRNNKVSTSETTKIGKYAGQVGEEQIHHESVFKSLLRVFRGIFGYNDKKKHIVIDSRYDKYGRRIDKTTYYYGGGLINGKGAGNKNKQKTLKQQQQEEIELLQQQIAEKERKITEMREKQEEAMIKVRQFVIDGNLQAMDGFNALNDIAMDGNKNSKIVRMLAMLEYKYEQCWYKSSKKYSKIPISVDYIVDYDENQNPVNIKLIKIKGRKDLYQKHINNLKRDAKNAIQKCDISKVDDLNKRNYKYWKQVKLTFKGQE